MTVRNFKGIVHGRTIELESDAGLPDGQAVDVLVTLSNGSQRLAPGEGIARSAGAWAEEAESLDEFLEWNRQQRSQHRAELGE